MQRLVVRLQIQKLVCSNESVAVGGEVGTSQNVRSQGQEATNSSNKNEMQEDWKQHGCQQEDVDENKARVTGREYEW